MVKQNNNLLWAALQQIPPSILIKNDDNKNRLCLQQINKKGG
jgi:hypothetical protein